MTTRLIQLALGEFYHIYNRGTDKRILFKDGADYRRFIELLFLSNTNHSVSVRDIRKTYSSIYDFERGNPLVHIGAYCVMPNHFHLLVTPAVENGIAKFMLKLSTAYSMYFNRRYVRTGVLFEGHFKARWVDDDVYLKYLFSYIHLNPVKLIQHDWKEEGIQDFSFAMHYLDEYQYSSFQDFEGIQRNERDILNAIVFPNYFPTGADFKKEILEWIQFDPDAQ